MSVAFDRIFVKGPSKRGLRQRRSKPMRYDGLLISRFALFNIAALAVLIAATLQGWPQRVLAGDSSHISILIVCAFVLCLLGSGYCAWRLGRDIDFVNRGPASAAQYRRNRSSEALQLELRTRISWIRYMASALAFSGLIGTVIGFIHALSAVEPSAASSVDRLSGLVAQLVQGMGIALYTTLVGAVASLWLSACHQMLHTATAKLTAAILDGTRDV